MVRARLLPGLPMRSFRASRKPLELASSVVALVLSSAVISACTLSRTLCTTRARSFSGTPACTFMSTFLARSSCPVCNNQRGVSGIRNNSTSCTNAGTAPKPTMSLHPCGSLARTHPNTYATTCPPVMNNDCTVTSLPLNSAGANSVIYSGTAPLAIPTAAPTNALPTTIVQTYVATAWITAPSTNNNAGTRMTLFRP